MSSRNLSDVPQFKVFLQGLPMSAESDVSPDVSKHTKFPARLRCFWYFVYSLLTKTVHFKTELKEQPNEERIKRIYTLSRSS